MQVSKTLFVALGVLLQVLYFVNGENYYTEVESLTPSQRESLAAFKKVMLPDLPEDYMKEDIYLIKYLKFNNFKIPKAQQHLKDTLKWREENNIEALGKKRSEDYLDLEREYPTFVGGYDKEGRPICEIPLGSWNVRAAAVAGHIQKLVIHFLVGCAEKGSRKVREQQALGKNVTEYIALMNMDGFSVSNHMCPSCLPLAVNLASGNDRYYPLSCSGIYLYNTPDSFAALLRLVRPVMSAPARASMKVFNSNEAEWKPFLEKRLDFTEVSDWAGGSKQRSTLP